MTRITIRAYDGCITDIYEFRFDIYTKRGQYRMFVQRIVDRHLREGKLVEMERDDG